ncbi:MAG: 2-amino-4-hydroxy-6-hydroxymethyldihydropteridine diphosphokinase [Rhodobiaceae bacterium]|nr:2-amino-4-hydroxy-6-hydroxymethyldihydropteridine diphosphokinase [Rhodobiaceae bacterium]MCC0050057.1 2-amino-4-hydroxy-6-hydroxymethyldihydropteridine diphosphokinase [Rhodobiaceae bacterium]
MTGQSVRAHIGLGGNIGDRKANLEAAISRLAATPGVTLAAQSSFIGTEPWGKTDQEWFLNAAVAIDTSLSARQLLEVCLGIETAMGRVREEKWGPRIIDLDVLTYGNETIYEDGLQVPHPYIAEREFVLEPLAEIAPDLIIDGKTVKEHLAAHTG